MGHPAGSDGLPDEQPQRLVYTAPFWIDRYLANAFQPRRNGKRPRAAPMAVATLGETSGTSEKPTAPAIGQGELSTFRAERTGMPFGSRATEHRLQKKKGSKAKCSPCRSAVFPRASARTACTIWQATSRNGCRIGITRTTTKRPPSKIPRDLLTERSKRCGADPGSNRLSAFARVIETGARWTAAQAAQDFAAPKMRSNAARPGVSASMFCTSAIGIYSDRHGYARWKE